MPLHIHDDEDLVFACPECDWTPVYRREEAVIDPEHDYRCDGCGATFDAPAERESRATVSRGVAKPRTKAGKMLLDADPDSSISWGGR